MGSCVNKCPQNDIDRKIIKERIRVWLFKDFMKEEHLYFSIYLYFFAYHLFGERETADSDQYFFSSRGGRAIEILPVRQPCPPAIFLLLVEMTGKAIVKDFSLDCSASCYK